MCKSWEAPHRGRFVFSVALPDLFGIGRLALQQWEPEHCITDFVEDEGRDAQLRFTVEGGIYGTPSRLIGDRLKVRLYNHRLHCYLSGALVHSTARVR